jgi:hypothetical protein
MFIFVVWGEETPTIWQQGASAVNKHTQHFFLKG